MQQKGHKLCWSEPATPEEPSLVAQQPQTKTYKVDALLVNSISLHRKVHLWTMLGDAPVTHGNQKVGSMCSRWMITNFCLNFQWVELEEIEFEAWLVESYHWTTNSVNTSYGVSVWRSIRILWPAIRSKSSFKVGNDRKVSFWEDYWIGQSSPRQSFPDIFNMYQQQNATVREVWIDQRWNLSFRYRRMFDDWEVERISAYSSLAQFRGTSEDVLYVMAKW